MNVKTLRIYDPPMCCSTGVCGPTVDPALTRFQSDLDWLSRQGVRVERFNLSQDPAAFAGEPLVKGELASRGTSVLPLAVADATVIARGTYPSRAELASAFGLQDPAPAVAELPLAGSSCCGPGCC
jgi:hypothetical protein